jgi:polyisoprenoid-binding protein YceI
MKRSILSSIVLLLALALPGLAAATDYIVQPAASTLGFTGTFQGETFNGHFDKWNAAIRYDAADLTQAAFDVTVTLASVKTGDSDRDGALPGSDFFDVAKFPTAHFVTTGFRRNGAQVVADGKLTLRGVTKPVSLDVKFQPAASGATLDVAGVVQRLDFGVGGGEYADTSVIGADVKVTAHLQLTAK